jgi:hypothetical protein
MDWNSWACIGFFSVPPSKPVKSPSVSNRNSLALLQMYSLLTETEFSQSVELDRKSVYFVEGLDTVLGKK